MRHSPLLSKYLAQFEKDPKSKVFAPLAEAYRRLGMYDEALTVLQKGLVHHPEYTTALVTLAHCYFDTGKFDKAYEVLSPLVPHQLENYTLQHLYGEVCLKLNFKEEALQTFKYLLFVNPRDESVSKAVLELEEKVLETYEESLLSPSHTDTTEDEWVQVDLNKDKDPQNYSIRSRLKEITTIHNDPETVTEKEGIRESFFDKQDPVMTFTLVDLYLQQRHYGKAANILEKIIELDPTNTAASERLVEVNSLMNNSENYKSEKQDLMSHYDSKFLKVDKVDKLQKTFNSFLKKIKDKAEAYGKNSNY